MFMKYSYFLWVLVFSVQSDADDCLSWFKKLNVKPADKICEIKCASALTDMNTFSCTSRCEEFCEIDRTNPSPVNQFVYYLGLTADELVLVAKNPANASKVYRAKIRAENVISENFLVDRHDTESDAVRHFVWAAFISKELGPDLAKTFLDAHEAGAPTSDPDRAMDLANNQSGLLAAESLKRQGKCTEENIVNAALTALRSKKLVVLKPGNSLRGKK